MSAAGPELPPHLLAKRKRQQEEEEADKGPNDAGAKRQKTPPKATRQVGPTLPPAPLDERPSLPPDDQLDAGGSEESSDDDIGPSLPGAGDEAEPSIDSQPQGRHTEKESTSTKSQSSSKRDEWMMVPPKQDDLAARLDPSKQRARGFNTGKSARPAPGSTEHDTWTETPEQKRKRLENQVMGVKAQAIGPTRPVDATLDKQREEDQRKSAKIRESRGQSLYQQHQGRKDRVEDDDPSKRTFDREKDIGGGVLGDKQKRELLNRAADFGSRFSKGSYL